MNVLVVDTSSWISYFRGKENRDIDLGLKEGRVFLPPLVAAELLSAKLKANEKMSLISFLSELPLCGSELPHWIRVGELRSKLAIKGFSLSTPDAHVAQCSLDLEGYLLTEDLIFQKTSKILGLKLL